MKQSETRQMPPLLPTSLVLTSLIIPPGPSSNPQKNDMQLSIVLEHLIPHTDSLMTVVASSAANKTINLITIGDLRTAVLF